MPSNFILKVVVLMVNKCLNFILQFLLYIILQPFTNKEKPLHGSNKEAADATVTSATLALGRSSAYYLFRAVNAFINLKYNK